jgi:hypothetical protein
MNGIRTAAMAGIALAALILGTTPAGATVLGAQTATCVTSKADDPNHQGKKVLAATACFQSDGDIFSIRDESADGWHVEVWWQAWDGEKSICRNLNGAGTSVTCKHDLTEGGKVRFGAYVMSGATVIDTGAEANVTI